MAAVIVLPVSAGAGPGTRSDQRVAVRHHRVRHGHRARRLCTVLGTLGVDLPHGDAHGEAALRVRGRRVGVNLARHRRRDDRAAFIAGHRTATAVLVAMTVGYVASIVVCPGLIEIFTGQPSRAGAPAPPPRAAPRAGRGGDVGRRVREPGHPRPPGRHRPGRVLLGGGALRIAGRARREQLPAGVAARGVRPRRRGATAHARTAVEARRIVATRVRAHRRPRARVARGADPPRWTAVPRRARCRRLRRAARSGHAPRSKWRACRSALDRRFSDSGIATVVGTAAGVGLNLLLAPRFGATGTAAAITSGLLLGRARGRAPRPAPLSLCRSRGCGSSATSW